MIKSQNWLLLNRFPKEREKYEEYTSFITKEKVEYAKAKVDEQDLKILKLINTMKISTSQQISRLLFKTHSIRYTNRRLQKLFELGCIDRFFPLKEFTKRSDFVHVVLGSVGAKLLKIEKFRKIKTLNQNWRHTVMVNEIFSVFSLKFKINSWRREIKISWEDHSTKKHTQQPDVFVRYVNQNKEKFAFIEMDMGSESIGTLLNKVKNYINYYKTYEFKVANWQPYRKDNIAIIPEIIFIMKYKKDAEILKRRLVKINSDIVFKVIFIDDFT